MLLAHTTCVLVSVAYVLLMFYLLVDLTTGVTVGNVSHDSKINWLEVIITLCDLNIDDSRNM